MSRRLEISIETEHVGTAALGCPAERRCATIVAVSEEMSTVRPPARGRCVAWLENSALLFISVLREIFDESAYARFLRRTRLSNSRAAYAQFLQEHEVAKARRPRCC
jgi:hypothetical protein